MLRHHPKTTDTPPQNYGYPTPKLRIPHPKTTDKALKPLKTGAYRGPESRNQRNLESGAKPTEVSVDNFGSPYQEPTAPKLRIEASGSPKSRGFPWLGRIPR